MGERSETHHGLSAPGGGDGFRCAQPIPTCELDLEIRLSFAGDDPEVAVAAERGAELHLDFIRPLCHFTDRRLKRRDEAGEGAKGGLEFLGAGPGDILGHADLRQAGFRRAAKMDFRAAGKFDYHLC
jgi:hypothetical protein